MTELERIGDLEIDEDMPFQRRMWAFQRVGWVAMALIVIGALLGAFGGRGPLAGAEVGDDSTFRLEYRRLTRHGAPDDLIVRLPPGHAAQDSTVTVWFGRDYFDGLEVSQVIPEPVEVLASPERVTYRFKLSDPGQAATIKFVIEANRSFGRQGEIGTSDSAHRFSQFVFP